MSLSQNQGGAAHSQIRGLEGHFDKHAGVWNRGNGQSQLQNQSLETSNNMWQFTSEVYLTTGVISSHVNEQFQKIPAPQAIINLESPSLPNSSVTDFDFGVETSYPYRVLLQSPVHSLAHDGLPLVSHFWSSLNVICLFIYLGFVVVVVEGFSLFSPGCPGTPYEDLFGFIFTF